MTLRSKQAAKWGPAPLHARKGPHPRCCVALLLARRQRLVLILLHHCSHLARCVCQFLTMPMCEALEVRKCVVAVKHAIADTVRLVRIVAS